jgi:hypothetical protein
MANRRHGTPSELFSLIPDDEPFGEVRERTAEEEALHVVRVSRRPLDDPGRRELRRGSRDGQAPHYRYDDEEPELDDPDRWAPDDDEETPDCEELLVVQHYAFDDTPSEEELA